MMPTWNEVLGITQEMSASTKKQMYRKAMNIAHPDKGGSDEQAQLISTAWAKVKDGLGYQHVPHGTAGCKEQPQPSDGNPHSSFHQSQQSNTFDGMNRDEWFRKHFQQAYGNRHFGDSGHAQDRGGFTQPPQYATRDELQYMKRNQAAFEEELREHKRTFTSYMQVMGVENNVLDELEVMRCNQRKTNKVIKQQWGVIVVLGLTWLLTGVIL